MPCAISDETVSCLVSEPKTRLPLVLTPSRSAAPTVMIEIEKYGQEHCERDGNEDIGHVDIPEGDEPSTVLGGKESFAGR